MRIYPEEAKGLLYLAGAVIVWCFAEWYIKFKAIKEINRAKKERSKSESKKND